jgi:hypothetical protein
MSATDDSKKESRRTGPLAALGQKKKKLCWAGLWTVKSHDVWDEVVRP